ncbi:MAG: site-2 protease family protein [Ignavibacteriaceae bacterium]|nr:site-2 protease family protein [Ignavibacteriaceae bacterium]
MENIQISERLISFLTFLPVFFISITFHEFAHAFSAKLMGDDTAKKQGRLSLNPLKHVDLIGTVIMPIASFATGFALIGWAKPVQINRKNFSNPLRDDAIVSFAGPLSNLVLALIFLLLFSLSRNWESEYHIQLINFFWYGVFLNVFLFAFNILPLPPLDGSHILFDLFPSKITAAFLNLGIYGSIVLMLFIYSPLWKYFMNLINLILQFFIKIAGT